MSKRTEEILKLLREHSGGRRFINVPGKVVSVDEPTQTCTVDIDGLEYAGIRLNAVVESGNENYSYIVPKSGSWVMVSFIENSETDAFLVSFSNIEKLVLNADEIVFNKGDLKGLAVSEKIIEKLNALEKDLNNLKSALSGWLPVPQDGGAALKTATSSWYGKLVVESKLADIENEKIKQ